METKTATIITKIEPSTKAKAEEICDDLGITLSSAISMFINKMIHEDGIPFEVKRERRTPISLDNLTKEQLNEELEKGYQDILNGRTKDFKKTIDDIKKDYGFWCIR